MRLDTPLLLYILCEKQHSFSAFPIVPEEEGKDAFHALTPSLPRGSFEFRGKRIATLCASCWIFPVTLFK